MDIKTSNIKSKVDSDFTKIYRPQSNFPNSGALWDECINAIKNPVLMNNIIFCNDAMKIPPVKTFLMSSINIEGGLSNEEKKSIGAFWGFIFKNILGYKSQKENKPINTKGIKHATYFYDKREAVNIID